jgi:hypothetical protein
MKDWQKGFLGGFILGSLGVAPLLLWLTEIKARLRCPNCGEHITIHKGSGEIVPQLETEGRRKGEGADDDNPEAPTKLSIAAAPTV